MKMRQGSLWSAVIVALASIVSIAGCRGDVGPTERVGREGLAATAATNSPAAPTTFDLAFPAGFGISREAIGASVDVTLGPKDKILAIDGSPGTVTNAGSGSVTVGPNGSTGSIVSAGSITLQPNVTATSAKSAGSVTLHPGDSVGTVTQNATVTPLAHRSVTVPALGGTATDLVVSSGSSTLTPGLYNNVNIQNTATATLSAGNYVISSFNLDAGATINLDTSQGTVNVFVTSSAVWNGQVTGDATRFVFSYLGTTAISFSGPFSGTALAPNAQINLGPKPSSYKANFYGQHVSVGPGVTVQQIVTPLIAASVSVSSTTVCMGQQTEVKLDASDAGPGALTQINGMPGSHQFVQFDGIPGPRQIVATVVTPDGRADFTTVKINVQSCAPGAGAPANPIVLHFWPTPDQANAVELMVHGLDANGQETPPAAPATYVWTFGDGATTTTTSPLVEHDYTGAVNPLSQYNYFTVSVTATTSSGSTTAQKVVPIWSVYAANRAKGIVQPPATVAAAGDNLQMTVTNYETTPLAITSARVDLLPCDPALDPIPQAAMPLSVTVPPSTSSTVAIPQPPAFSTAICAVGAHLFGSAAAGTVYTDSYARVKENPLTKQAVTDPNSIAILNQASAYTADPNQFDFRELRQLQAQGVITQMPAAVAAGATYENPGDTCSPGDTAPGLVCQPTPDWVANPGELLNAFKGDFIVHHACGDMIADLLESISQNYSHSMTVTKNRAEIRHSTASQGRISGALTSSLMLDPGTMQFGFPGTAGTTAYTVDQMVHGYCVADPDGSGGDSNCPKGSWYIGGSLHPDPMQCKLDLPVVYPLVIRPPPDATTAQLQAVTPVGDQALSISGHYRFFMYSRADEYGPATATSSSSVPPWAVGTEESVCSLFDLEATRQAGPGGMALPLNGTGRNNGTGLADGMRSYSVDERNKAAVTLFTDVLNAGEGLIPPGWAQLVSIGTAGLSQGAIDAVAGRVANQMVNCFASDACNDTGPTWMSGVGPGMAVSPQDITNWATPQNGGTYGYNEPLVYAPTSYRHRYAWAVKAGDASMTVKVVDGNNNPIQNATVILNSVPYGSTDSSGTLQVPSLDEGTYDVEAQDYLGPPLDGGAPPGQVTTPTPTPMTPTEIFALPPCASPQTGLVSPCKVTGSNPSCPDSSGGVQSGLGVPWGSECVVGSVNGVGSTCACFAPQAQTASCDLAVADRPATVPASGSVTVELTLCTNCQNGVPQSCTQHCASTADCDNNMVCNGSDCSAPPRMLNIQTEPGATLLVQNDNFFSPDQYVFPVSFQMTCDPNGTGLAVETICDSFGTGDQAVFTVTCKEDQPSGEIEGTLEVSLAENCGSGASIKDDKSIGYTLFAPDPSSSVTDSFSFQACYESALEFTVDGFTSNSCVANNLQGNLDITEMPAQ